MLTLKQKVKLVGYSLGIFICFSIFGLLHERIFKEAYFDGVGEDGKKTGEMFSYAFAFVGFHCIVYALFSKGFLIATRAKTTVETNSFYYFWIATFVAVAMVTGSMALEHISYPTQVIAKSSKPIPVMLLGVLIGRKSYSPQKYFFVLMIVVAVVTFVYKDKHENKDGANQILGLCLIGLSLLMDGLTGAVQDRMRSFSKPSSMDFMYNVNAWSSAVLITAMAVTGEGRDMILFIQRHPSILLHLGLTSLVGTAGQVFISSMITSFGSLPCSIVTTTRKFFTVLLSVLIHNNVLSLRQWFATVILFSILLLDSYLSKRSVPEPEAIEQEDEEAHVGLSEKNGHIIVETQILNK